MGNIIISCKNKECNKYDSPIYIYLKDELHKADSKKKEKCEECKQILKSELIENNINKKDTTINPGKNTNRNYTKDNFKYKEYK